MSATAAGITADLIYQQALCEYETVGAEELGRVYQQMIDEATRKKHSIYYTPEPVAHFLTKFATQLGLHQIGPEPEEVMRIVALDPTCGAGIMLVHAARLLSHAYASRLIADPEPSGDLILAVMPRVILECVYGVDNDPIAVDLARLALSLETVGALTPDMLARHIVCDSVLQGPDHLPPALRDRQR
jgi:type I restriction-modification system DNA methylase subunit